MPPDYKVEKITAPVAFYHGGNDWLAVESVSSNNWSIFTSYSESTLNIELDIDLFQ